MVPAPMLFTFERDEANEYINKTTSESGKCHEGIKQDTCFLRSGTLHCAEAAPGPSGP